MKKIRVWAKATWNQEEFQEINFLKFESLRSEEKGLGAGVCKILLTNYSPYVRDSWEFGQDPHAKDLTNHWIFVQATDIAQGNALLGGDADLSDPEYMPEGNNDPSFIWWGYCGEYTKEIQRKSGDCRGSLNLYEVGHWLNKQKINYFGGNSNGFNPIFDSAKGIPVGNKDVSNAYTLFDTFGFIKNGSQATIDPTQTTKFFTVKEAVNHMVMRAFDLTQDVFYLIADWSAVDLSDPNAWLNQAETIESFEGKNITEALETILDYYSWTFFVTSDGNVKLKFFPRYNQPSNNLFLDESNESFVVTAEQQKYDHIELTGDRILFYNSLTTYTPMKDHKNIGIFPKWTDDELREFVSPIDGPNEDLRQVTDKVKKADPEEAPENDKGDSLTDNEENQLDRELGYYKALRQKNSKKVYQDFKFGYCNPSGPSTSGICLATWIRCGDYDYPGADQNTAANLAISCYPFVSTQKDLDTATENGILTKTPADLIKSGYDIISDLNANDAADANLSNHQTPTCTEMKYVTTALVPDANNANYLQSVNTTATFYYRTYGSNKEFTNGIYPRPLWLDGTKGGSGLMSSKLSFDWDGVTLDSDEPEVFACCYDAIYQSANETTFLTTVKDYGVEREEWYGANVGASNFDYVHRDTMPNWVTIAHWGRMVFSFGSYSAQRITLDYGVPDYTRTLRILDESYKMAIVRPGYVYGTEIKTYPDDSEYEDGISLKYNDENKIIVNDMPKMAARMSGLWDYYSKDKRAIKLTNALFNNTGRINQPLGVSRMAEAIGKFIGTITNTDGRVYDINSYVSSYEFDFNNDQPRILCQTEYPDSPKSTRTKQVWSVWKNRKQDWSEQ